MIEKKHVGCPDQHAHLFSFSDMFRLIVVVCCCPTTTADVDVAQYGHGGHDGNKKKETGTFFFIKRLLLLLVVFFLENGSFSCLAQKDVALRDAAKKSCALFKLRVRR